MRQWIGVFLLLTSTAWAGPILPLLKAEFAPRSGPIMPFIRAPKPAATPMPELCEALLTEGATARALLPEAWQSGFETSLGNLVAEILGSSKIKILQRPKVQSESGETLLDLPKILPVSNIRILLDVLDEDRGQVGQVELFGDVFLDRIRIRSSR